MKTTFLAIISILVGSWSTFAVTPVFQNYQWDDQPAVHSLSPAHQQLSAVVLQDHRIIEYQVANAKQNFCYHTVHKIIRLNDAQAIEKFNKVYIPRHGGKFLVSLAVRVIKPNGEIIHLNRQNMKELANAEGHGNFSIFAAEGLENGSELEYIYTLRSGAVPFGRETFQGEEPVLSASFMLVYPRHLRFLTKSYNQLPTLYEEHFDAQRRHLVMRETEIPALPKEEYAAYQPNLMRVDYKLDGSGMAHNLYNWTQISDQLFNHVYDSKGASKVNRLVASLKLDALSEEEKVRRIEQYIKTHYTLNNGNAEEDQSLKHIIKNKHANEIGITKLYFQCWKAAGIHRPQLVFTDDRQNNRIDPDFATFTGLNQLLFYFPRLNKYLVPNNLAYRLGLAPSEVADNMALFITYNDETASEYLSHRLGKVEGGDFTKNAVGVNATVTFPKDVANPNIVQENFYHGYRAIMYRRLFVTAPQDKHEEIMRNIATSGIEDPHIDHIALENDASELSADLAIPLKIKATYQASSLIEKAGPDYLFQVGKIIGQQQELYQEKERNNDIVIPAPTDYHHTLTVHVPVGYQIKGLESIAINNELKLDNEVAMRFVSYYEYEDNALTIHINEQYKVLHLPRERYSEFREIINAAADFNKISLILTRQR